MAPLESGRPTFAEWAASNSSEHAGRALGSAADKEFHRQATIAVAKRAETVVNHPGWQTFLDHLGALRDAAQTDIEYATRRVANAPVGVPDLVEYRRQIASHAGAVRALERAMSLIPTLIDNGLAAQDEPPDASTSSAGLTSA
jgi:hypothetical protein